MIENGFVEGSGCAVALFKGYQVNQGSWLIWITAIKKDWNMDECDVAFYYKSRKE